MLLSTQQEPLTVIKVLLYGFAYVWVQKLDAECNQR